MNQLPPRGLPATAAYLRDLAATGQHPTPAGHFREIAAQLDRSDRELRHLRGLAARIRDIPTPEDLQFLADIDEDWRRAQDDINAEIASGA